MSRQEAIDVTKHILVPKHEKLTEEEVAKLLGKYKVSIEQLPKMLLSDAAIKHLNPEVGEVIRVVRKSPTLGLSEYYRVVVNG